MWTDPGEESQSLVLALEAELTVLLLAPGPCGKRSGKELMLKKYFLSKKLFVFEMKPVSTFHLLVVEPGVFLLTFRPPVSARPEIGSRKNSRKENPECVKEIVPSLHHALDASHFANERQGQRNNSSCFTSSC
jgi:hypothetical protein